MVAVNEEEAQVLEELLERGRRNGVPGLEIISGKELRQREPLIRPDVVAALWAPTGDQRSLCCHRAAAETR